jgi:hypothetical protein
MVLVLVGIAGAYAPAMRPHVDQPCFYYVFCSIAIALPLWLLTTF